MSSSSASASTRVEPSMSKELLEKITGCKVLCHSCEDATQPGDNYMGVMYSVTAEVVPRGKGSSEKETRHYVLKCYPRHPARQRYLNKINIFYNELCFYKVWTRELLKFQTDVVGNPSERVIKLAIPPCIGGVAVNFLAADEEALTKIYDPFDNFIMMVDVKKSWGYELADRRLGLGPDHVQLVIHELATLHALSWAYKSSLQVDLVEKFPFLNIAVNKEEIAMWYRIMEENLKLASSAFDAAFGADDGPLTKSNQRFKEVALRLTTHYVAQREEAEQEYWGFHRDPPKELVEASANDEPWRVICHGDTWVNNMLFQHNEEGKPSNVILLDFQVIRQACPTGDLVYMIYTSTTAGFRKTHLDQVLLQYFRRFVEVCDAVRVEPLPDFSFESLKRRFHRSKIIGYMMAVYGLPVMLSDKDKSTNLEEADKNADIEKVFSEAFEKGGTSSGYASRMIGVAQELYDEGVI